MARSPKGSARGVRTEGVLCGTDFSPAATQATHVAAVLAKRLDVPLDLVHVSEIPEFPAIREAMREEVARVRRLDVPVHGAVAGGNVDEVLVARADPGTCRLIVLSALGKRAPDRWFLGSVPERTAERAGVPTLIVRDAAPFDAWMRGQRPLRVFVAFNMTATSEAALRWARDLQAIGPCDIVVGCVDWPPEQRARLGGGGPLPLVGNSPDVQAILERDVHARVVEVLGELPFLLRVEANWGRPDAHLARMATDQDCDLVVVGSHQYRGFERLWHASVSRALLHGVHTNVAVVPRPNGERRDTRIAPPVQRVLACTDFSDLANQSISHAYALVREALVRGGGTVHLVHVAHPQSLPEGEKRRGLSDVELEARHAAHVQACVARLRALVPAEAARLGITTDIAVIEHRDVAEAICQAAERLGVEVICLGTHGRSGPSAVLLGSVASGVMARSTRPLLTVREVEP